MEAGWDVGDGEVQLVNAPDRIRDAPAMIGCKCEGG